MVIIKPLASLTHSPTQVGVQLVHGLVGGRVEGSRVEKEPVAIVRRCDFLGDIVGCGHTMVREVTQEARIIETRAKVEPYGPSRWSGQGG